MKKLLLVLALMSTMGVYGQDMYEVDKRKYERQKEMERQKSIEPLTLDFIELNEVGAYERKEVITADGISANMLFSRAMEALSDWTGPDGRAKLGTDYSDKETGTIIYKGTYSLGFRTVYIGDGWSRAANLILKVRCKDGRAQITLTVPTVTATYSGNGAIKDYTISELKKAVAEAKKKKKRENGIILLRDLKETADNIVERMKDRLKNGVDDEF